jgi:hypothetical protein
LATSTLENMKKKTSLSSVVRYREMRIARTEMCGPCVEKRRRGQETVMPEPNLTDAV